MEFPIYAGLIAAIFHVITGPDHLAAVTPFAIESKKKAWKVGVFWGLGHLVGMSLIGVLFILFEELIPVEKISAYSEQMVGFVLIFIGIWAFYQVFNTKNKHQHLHVHSEQAPVVHKHSHLHEHGEAHHHEHGKKIKNSYFTSFSVGVLHGLAGVAHFILFLPILGLDSIAASVQYIVGFAFGTVIAMTTYAFVIGKIASLAKKEHNEDFFKGVRLAGGFFAIVIGIYWLFL